MDTSLSALFQTFMAQYGTAMEEVRISKNYKHSLAEIVRKSIPEQLADIVNTQDYTVKGSVGAGSWASVPWIAIFDKAITNSAQKGVYIVYLLNKDTQTLYLTLIQGVTNIAQQGNSAVPKATGFTSIAQSKNKQALAELQTIASGIRERMGGGPGDSIASGSKAYDMGAIFCKAYSLSQFPDDEALRSDLLDFVELYRKYKQLYYGVDTAPTSSPQETTDMQQEYAMKDIISQVKAYISAKGFAYPEGTIENFYLSLKSKPFVILAGTSGTGKTRLVKLFAEAIAAEYKLVPVRPDWSDSSDLFGHVDLNGTFVPGAILNFVKQASVDLERPYFLCLDEMNLARVEYYMSDLLSIIETREFNDENRIVTEPFLTEDHYGGDTQAIRKYGRLSLPENLYIIGTVNMDETTFPFSRKVLDRANTIEFSYVDLMPQTFDAEPVAPMKMPNAFLKTNYLLLHQCGQEEESVAGWCVELQKINQILQTANAHVGYRVRDEVVFYLLNNQSSELLDENAAMDNEIMQKILPRIQGSSYTVKTMLCELFQICAGDYKGYQTDANDISAEMLKAASGLCLYPKSAKKIAFMVRRYEEDGFTSYWL